MIKALIFDFDGLILDTETPEFIALNEAYAGYGQSLSIQTFGQVVGSDYNLAYDPISHLQALTGQSLDAGQFWEKVNRRRLEIIVQKPVLPGVETILEQALARGLKLAVASSSSHAWVEGHLRRLNLFDRFDVIKCKEDVAKIKPEPDLFLAVLGALNISAREAVILEDSLNGVRAAQKAGIPVIVVPNQITLHQQMLPQVPQISSLANVSLDELLSNSLLSNSSLRIL